MAPTATTSPVRTAPWASPRALARLGEIERGLPSEPVAALGAALAAAADHERLLAADALVLNAGGSVPTAVGAANHHPMLSGQSSMGYAGDKFQAGLEALDVVEVAVSRLVADVMGARFAEVRPPSATLANLAVYTAFAEPGDTIAVLPAWAGGHFSHHEVGAPGIRGLRVVDLPYDLSLLDVDLDRVAALLARERPKLVVVGASLMLHAHRLAPLADLVHGAGARLLYDASHVAGLVAEGRFQTPLADGADLVTFSTYKSFGGPAGGAIVANDPDLMERVATAVYPGLTANYDISRLLPLATAAVEHQEWAGEYADACIATARALGDALLAEELEVVTCDRGPTSSHHLAVDVTGFGGGPQAARTLGAANILLSEMGLPSAARDPQGAIRIGTQTVVRHGLSAGEMGAVADLIAAALHQRRSPRALRAEVAELRRRCAAV